MLNIKKMVINFMKYYNIIVADIETILSVDDNNKHIPIMIGLYDNIVTKIFIKNDNSDLIQDFISYLLNNYQESCLIYLHNFAKFDGYLLLNALIKTKYKPELIIRDNQIYSLKLKINKKELYFKDSYLMIPYSLKKASLLFNKQYFKTDIPLDLFNNWLVNSKLISDYLLNDLFTLYELIKNYNLYLKINFNTEIYYSLTIPSLTQKIFLEQFFKHDFINLSTNQDKYIREGYLGSITDIYKPYGKDLIKLDFNSMYPAIMQKTKFSLGKAKFIHKIDDLQQFCKDNNAFIKVKVNCKKDLKYPLITIKYNNKNIQPTGSFIQTI